MVITKKDIQELREKAFFDISPELEALILEKLGSEPGFDEDGHYYEYSEQDIWEQLRKLLRNNY